jgi:glycosyltransferase involved in cell wall biosynthesis/predicted Zn-dependent protease
MKLIGHCVGLVGADSWAKSFSALAEIPTVVFEPIKGADLCAWKDPSDWVFIEPWKSIKMVRGMDEFRAAFDKHIAQLPGTDLETEAEPVLAWEGSFLDYGSLSHINRELTARLPKVKCVGSTVLPACAKNDAAMKRCAKNISAVAPANTTVTVRHQWPPNWSRPDSGSLVVIQPWEYGHLPQAWVAQAANVDEFWVPSPLVRHMYVDSGIAPEKVRVVPNGVDSAKFHPSAKPLKLATKKKFKFLFVGGTIHRKGPDVLLEAFTRTFTAADDVCLVIKDFGGDSCYQGQTAEAAIKAIQKNPNAPEILYLKEELSSEQMPSLYTACNCLVLPYRGEGFGMPVLEAMSCGVPVIVTAGGATDSFVSVECGWKIPAQGMRLNGRIGDIALVKSGWLLEPSKAHLMAAMKAAAANPADCRKCGDAGRCVVERRFDWNDIAAAVSHRLKELAARAPMKTEAPAITPVKTFTLPDVAKIGRLDEARELFAQKEYEAAWNAAIAAIAQRPFHPEAFLLLAETAQAAGDFAGAKRCAEHAHTLAPGFEAAKKFLKQKSAGNGKPGAMNLDSVVKSGTKPRISVCLITKNEEKFLGQCLKSVRGLATQIIVADTGSTDRTVEIAREFGAEIYSFAWCDDFSAARNAAIEHAHGDWILILDADEELTAAQHAKLLGEIRNPEVLGFRLPLVNAGQESEGRSFIPRLFRNAPGVFFHGRIHEQVFPSLLPLCKTWGMNTALGSAELLHHGYTKELVRDRNKVERNLKLLRQATAENPADANLLMNLGLELVRSDDLPAGIAKYREAFALMSRQTNEIVPELREALLTQFTSQLYKVRGHEEVVRVLNSPLAKNHGGLNSSLHLALGLSLFELKRFAEAVPQMRDCIAKRSQPALTPINVDIHTAAPWHCLALCQLRIGATAEAEKSFEQAVAATGRTNEARVDFAKFLAEQNRAVDALKQLHAAITADATCALAWRLGSQIALAQPELLDFALDWTGEALKHLPADAAVKAQRAEALLIAGNVAAAAPLWADVWEKDRLPRSLAALCLCRMVDGKNLPAAGSPAEEEQCSRAFIGWYQRLLGFGAQTTAQAVNERLSSLAATLPTAQKILLAAFEEARHESEIPTGA